MQHFRTLIHGGALAALCLCLQGQTPPPKEPAPEYKGMPPRATPADYQGHAKIGDYTLAAESTGHNVVSVQGTLETDEYLVFEVGFFGPPNSRLKLSVDDFTLRVNGNKKALPSQQYGVVLPNVKDPEWQPPEPAGPKSKTSIGGLGGGDDKPAPGDPPPPPPKPPFELVRANAQRVAKAAMPEGDRLLPQAGLIFFHYTGQMKKINSLELIYNGPAGNTSIRLHP